MPAASHGGRPSPASPQAGSFCLVSWRFPPASPSGWPGGTAASTGHGGTARPPGPCPQPPPGPSAGSRVLPSVCLHRLTCRARSIAEPLTSARPRLGAEGGQEAPCLHGSAGRPPARSQGCWAWGQGGAKAERDPHRPPWGGGAGGAIASGTGCPGRSGSRPRAGGARPALPRTPAAPAAASSALPSQEKALCFHCRLTPSSRAGGNAPGCLAALPMPLPMSPRPLLRRVWGCQALGTEGRGGRSIPLGAACPRCSLPALGILLGADPGPAGRGGMRGAACPPAGRRRPVPSALRGRHRCHPLPCPVFALCHAVRDPGPAGHGRAGVGDALPGAGTTRGIAAQVPGPRAAAQGALAMRWPWRCRRHCRAPVPPQARPGARPWVQGAGGQASVPEQGQARGRSQRWLPRAGARTLAAGRQLGGRLGVGSGASPSPAV